MLLLGLPDGLLEGRLCFRHVRLLLRQHGVAGVQGVLPGPEFPLQLVEETAHLGEHVVPLAGLPARLEYELRPRDLLDVVVLVAQDGLVGGSSSAAAVELSPAAGAGEVGFRGGSCRGSRGDLPPGLIVGGGLRSLRALGVGLRSLPGPPRRLAPPPEPRRSPRRSLGAALAGLARARVRLGRVRRREAASASSAAGVASAAGRSPADAVAGAGSASRLLVGCGSGFPRRRAGVLLRSWKAEGQCQPRKVPLLLEGGSKVRSLPAAVVVPRVQSPPSPRRGGWARRCPRRHPPRQKQLPGEDPPR